MSDIEINLEINKKKPCKIKLTEEEKKARFKESQKKYINKPEVKEKRNEYYKAKYHKLDEEAKKNFSHNFLTKYHNMNDEEYQNFLIQCRPYKRKYRQKKIDENKLLEEQQQIIINKERERTINNRTINAMKDPRYNDYVICV